MMGAVVQTTYYFPPTLQRGRWARSARRGSRLRLQALEVLLNTLCRTRIFILLRGSRRFDPLHLRYRFSTHSRHGALAPLWLKPARAWEKSDREVDR